MALAEARSECGGKEEEEFEEEAAEGSESELMRSLNLESRALLPLRLSPAAADTEREARAEERIGHQSRVRRVPCSAARNLSSAFPCALSVCVPFSLTHDHER